MAGPLPPPLLMALPVREKLFIAASLSKRGYWGKGGLQFFLAPFQTSD